MKLAILLLSVTLFATFEAKHQRHHVEKKEGALKEKDGQHLHKKLVMGKKHKHRPLSDSPDTVYKAAWMKIANFHKADKSLCKDLNCRKREICMVNKETHEAECMPKKVIRQGERQRKQKGRKDHEDKERPKRKLKEGNGQFDFRKKSKHVKDVKDNALEYQKKYSKNMKNKLAHIKMAFDYLDGPPELRMKKEDNDLSLYSNTLDKPKKECSQKELREMGRRLLDWFKLLQDENKTTHHKEKRNSKKKDLHDDGECICQAPVSWQFLQLDDNLDAKLDVTELRAIERNGYEHCVTPFIEACDHDKDTTLSEREWCCCFADILPPCMAAQKKVPSEIMNGTLVVLPGAHVPVCDEDGFFQELQCHSSTGYCWCVDRNGHEVAGTRSRGMPKCGKDKRKRHELRSKKQKKHAAYWSEV